jgi:triacylglycerol lipase
MNILLVHGMFDTGAIFRRLVMKLSERGHRCFAPSLTPNDGRHGLTNLAEKLEVTVNETFDSEEPLVIIGFSMGCLISRYYLHRMNAARRTRAFFAISGPHRGSLLAYLYPGYGAEDMRPGSAFLQELDAVDHSVNSFPIYTYWTPLDLMVLPAISSRWAPATERIIWSPLHPLMPSNRTVCADIISKIEKLESLS